MPLTKRDIVQFNVDETIDNDGTRFILGAGVIYRLTATCTTSGGATLEVYDASSVTGTAIATATASSNNESVEIRFVDEYGDPGRRLRNGLILHVQGSAGETFTLDDLLAKEEDFEPVGLEWNIGTDTWNWIDLDGNTIDYLEVNNRPPWKNITRVNLAPDGSINAKLGDGNYAADGSNGNVMVEYPKYYVKASRPEGGVRRWWVHDSSWSGFEVHPAFVQRGGTEQDYVYLGAYEACLKDNAGTVELHSKTGEQPITGGEIDSLGFNSGSTEFTESETLTGATSGATGDVVDWHLASGSWGSGNAAGTVYLKQVSGTFQSENLNGSVGGLNMASATGASSALALTISNARTYAGNIGSGWGIETIWSLSMLQLLMAIEYKGFGVQTGIGKGIVNKSSGSGFAGEETGFDGIDNQLDSEGTGTGTGTDGLTPVCWRYLENHWGNVWTFVDGYNAVDAEYRIVNSDGSGTLADTLTAGNYEATNAAPITSDGYINDILYESLTKYLFIPNSTGGSSSTYIPDYFWAHDSGETNVLLSGGGWPAGLQAGAASLASTYVASSSARHLGARLEFIG